MERDAFISNLSSVSRDLASIESFPPGVFQSIEDKGGGWLSINGNNATPSQDSYYVGTSGSTPAEVAIKVYLPNPTFSLWFSTPAQWYSDGFIIVPFAQV